MALQTAVPPVATSAQVVATASIAEPSVAPSAQVVANAFVEQYYHILHHTPELVYRFYQNTSVLSRQEANGEMTSVTSFEGINEKILSFDYKNYKAEIKTADAQESYNGGVLVLVTGCLTGKDNLIKNFAQSFFLAPQSKGFFVLNDVFRYVDDCEPLETNVVSIAKVDDSGSVPIVAEIEPLYTPDASAQELATSNEDDQINIEKPTRTFDREHVANEEIPAISQSTENQLSTVTEPSPISFQDDGVKNSYASIVKKAKGYPGPTKVYVPTNMVRSAPRGTQGQASRSITPASAAAAEPSVERKVPASTNVEEGAAVEGHSIYVRNLPINVTVAELEQEFKKFGLIKEEGVQVRSNRQQGTCYGFVEFLSASSMENALQASPIMIGGRQAFVEIKRSGAPGDGGRGRLPSGRGGFRSDNFRGRGGYVGGGRGFGGRGEYSSRGRGRAGRGVDGYQGRGRGRHSGVNRTNDAS